MPYFVASLVLGFSFVTLLLLHIRLRKTVRILAQNEEALLKRSGMFSQILDSISDLVLVKETNSRIVWANKAFCGLYGMSNEQLNGIVDSPVSPPDHTQQYVRDDNYVASSGKSLNIPKEPVTQHDGEIRFYNTVKSPIFDGTGKVTMTVGVSRDITEQLNQQEIIQRQQQKMITNAKLTALGEMSGGIAHEVNNPIAIIEGKVRQIKKKIECKAISNDELLTELTKIETTSKRIVSIVRALQTFARDGNQDPSQPISMRALIEDTLQFCQERFRSHNIRLTTLVEDEVVPCRGVQISQVLLNLLNNAHDAVLSVNQPNVTIKTRHERNFLLIDVEDNGPGVPKDVEDKIFQPFFTMKKIGEGTGIGLSVSLGIAESHGGSLTYTRHSNETRFTLSLPLQTSPSNKSPCQQQRNGLSGCHQGL